LLIDVLNPLRGNGSNLLPVAPRLPSQPQQRLDFIQREPELLRSLDEPDEPDRVLRELSIARSPTRWLGQQSAALVVAEGLHVHAGLLGRLADCHRRLPTPNINLVPRCNVKCEIDWKSGGDGMRRALVALATFFMCAGPAAAQDAADQ